MTKNDTSLRRKAPPTVAEVKIYQWWWNFPVARAGVPHVMKLDVADGKIIHPDVSLPNKFIAEDWPGDWAPCIPPY